MTTQINDSHDKLFKTTFSFKKPAIDFLKARLDERILKELLLNTLKLEKTSFMDENLKEFHSDVVYRVDTKDGTGYCCLLLEHQSTPDKKMVIRLIEYMARIWRHHAATHKDNKLPIIWPIVLYTGKRKYHYARSLSAGFSRPDLMSSKVFDEVFLLDIFRDSQETILKDGQAALVELLLREEDIEKALQSKYIQENLPKQKRLIKPVVIYSLSKFQGDEKEIKKKLIKIVGEQKVMSAAQQIKRKGWQEGRLEGRLEEKRNIIRNLYAGGVSVQEIAKLLKIDLKEVKTLLKK